jgi:uncharacterized damage-inducible protein DinB
MKLFYKELFEFSHDMNQKVIDALIRHPDNVSEKSVKLISHILSAQNIWNSRINKQAEAYTVWQVHSLGHLKNIDVLNYEKSCHIADNVDLDKTISYVNSKGQAYNNSVKDILFHVINHSTYHRAQIASDFKQNGSDPLITDYIFYKR